MFKLLREIKKMETTQLQNKKRDNKVKKRRMAGNKMDRH